MRRSTRRWGGRCMGIRVKSYEAMVIEGNGTIRFAFSEGGGLDAVGNPVARAEEWGDALPCDVRPVGVDRQAESESGARLEKATYEVYVDLWDTAALPDEPSRVRLSLGGRDLGVFPVIFVDCLPLVGVVRYYV